jgi:hypothetical protein
VINGTNLLRKDNPRCPNGNAAETISFLLVAHPALTAPRGNRHGLRLPGLPRLTRLPRVPDWLNGLTHHAGATLFAKNDAEARWRHWQIIELRGGLARRYRDVRFDALRALRDAAEQMSARIDSPRWREQDGPR